MSLYAMCMYSECELNFNHNKNNIIIITYNNNVMLARLVQCIKERVGVQMQNV
jgi:hypothetical protein